MLLHCKPLSLSFDGLLPLVHSVALFIDQSDWLLQAFKRPIWWQYGKWLPSGSISIKPKYIPLWTVQALNVVQRICKLWGQLLQRLPQVVSFIWPTGPLFSQTPRLPWLRYRRQRWMKLVPVFFSKCHLVWSTESWPFEGRPWAGTDSSIPRTTS